MTSASNSLGLSRYSTAAPDADADGLEGGGLGAASDAEDGLEGATDCVPSTTLLFRFIMASVFKSLGLSRCSTAAPDADGLAAAPRADTGSGFSFCLS
jgi:hypothetical protein